MLPQFSLCKKLNLINSLCFPCLEKLTAKFPVFPVPWPPWKDYYSKLVRCVTWDPIGTKLSQLDPTYCPKTSSVRKHNRSRLYIESQEFQNLIISLKTEVVLERPV